MHCCYFVVLVVYGVICRCVGQNDDVCYQAMGRTDFKLFDQSCFWVSPTTDKRSWNDGQSICSNHFRGNLATVARQETVAFLKENLDVQNGKYWIGLYINASDLSPLTELEKRRQINWKWLDGTIYSNEGSIGWKNGYPAQTEVLGYLLDFEWAAATASASAQDNQYICETKVQGGPAGAPPEDTTDKVPPDTPQADCGDKGQWTYNEDTNFCYSLRTESLPLDWNAAKEKCNQLNGHLATPSTEMQNKAVLGIISEKKQTDANVWIGLWHKTGATGNQRQGWQWLNDAPYVYQAWRTGEPQSNEKYARINEGDWAGTPGGLYTHYLCQKAPPPPPPPPPPETPPPPSKPVDPVETPMSDEPNVKDPENKNTFEGRGVPSDNGKKKRTDIRGPVLGVVLVAILVALIIGVLLIRRRGSTQFESLARRMKIPHLSKKSRGKLDSTTGADTSYSIVEKTLETPLAATTKSTVFTPEQEKPEYATVPAKKTAKPKLYATVKAYLTAPKPSIKRASSLEGLDTGSGRAYENTFISTIVRVEELNDWVKEAIASGLIEKQYKSIPTSTQSKEYCNQEHLKPKNRYRNIVPYDNNRVELSALPNDPHSHYINASYIDSYKQKKTFIAAQGPTVNTVNDFWRMIWEKSIKTVVMVSNQFEAETAKMNFVRYWPKGKEKEPFGDISVAIKKVENLPDYIVRHMSVSKGSDIKIVKQFQFKSWPDHGVPKHAMALINFREKIRKEMSKGKEPVLVHCSAGVGRTGTIIAIDYLLQQAAKEGVVDFVTCLRKLRKQRTDMVQRLTQYQFIIRAVLEALTLGQTAIACSLYAQTVQTFQDPLTDGDTRMQKQFEMLVHYFTEEKSSEVAAAAELPENIKKNRDPKVLPASSKRVLLMTPVSGKNDYINAVFVDGHRRKSAYIATHAPLQHTIIDFWRAVFDYNSTVIVMLCPKYYLKTDEVYFPEGLGEKFDCTPFEIECLEEDDHNGVRRTQLSLKYCGLERHLVHFSLTEDLSGMSLDEKMATIHSIYENAKKWQQQQTEKNAPITVHCLEGTEWTGLYCILSNLFDQINEEQEVDVFHAVGQSRLARREFISTMKEYEMVYDIIALYIDQFNMYSNFL